jgi:hypothetical protein
VASGTGRPLTATNVPQSGSSRIGGSLHSNAVVNPAWASALKSEWRVSTTLRGLSTDAHSVSFASASEVSGSA